MSTSLKELIAGIRDCLFIKKTICIQRLFNKIIQRGFSIPHNDPHMNVVETSVGHWTRKAKMYVTS